MINYCFILFYSVLIITTIDGKDENDCVMQRIHECQQNHKINPRFYPTDLDQLKQYCRTIEQNDECLSTVGSQCLNDTANVNTEDVINHMNKQTTPHYRDICNYTSTYSRLFVKYGKCLKETVSEQNKCQNKYRVLIQSKEDLLLTVGYSRNNSRSDNYQKIRQICCWWAEYQTCAMKMAIDRCGQQAAVLLNEEFHKLHTSSSTAKMLTYRSCLPQDQSYTFPACFLDHSLEPNPMSVIMDNNELDVEENSRIKDLQQTLQNKDLNGYNQSDFTHLIEASTYNSATDLCPHLIVTFTLYLLTFIKFTCNQQIK
ncbi:uncharacterized protein LOC128958146 [Oppia nitens]|uniref:uncharacterized protein LOC128958146 n=1 Tax=Oppia nitens TaxID=1686743 RepID=UPI0023DA4ED0|nr:uncharacterized protein LOC128958146 [Oppia nitens]